MDDSDEPSPGFGAMAALAALGAAMFAGRRGLLDEQDAE
ncbi:MAG: PGF-CTERM sorting domain-containing protein [Candidatus Poseidoniaceae archaeon]